MKHNSRTRALYDLPGHVFNADSVAFHWNTESGVKGSNKSNLYENENLEESDDEGMEEQQISFDLHGDSAAGLFRQSRKKVAYPMSSFVAVHGAGKMKYVHVWIRKVFCTNMYRVKNVISLFATDEAQNSSAGMHSKHYPCFQSQSVRETQDFTVSMEI